jgi:hypothetical protein
LFEIIYSDLEQEQISNETPSKAVPTSQEAQAAAVEGGGLRVILFFLKYYIVT